MTHSNNKETKYNTHVNQIFNLMIFQEKSHQVFTLPHQLSEKEKIKLYLAGQITFLKLELARPIVQNIYKKIVKIQFSQAAQIQ